MKVSLALFFSSLIVDILADDCPAAQCPTTDLPSVVNGKIILTVYYDNDPYSRPEKPNTDLVKIVCDALDAFGDELEAHFKVGAGSERNDEKYFEDDPDFYCRYDCDQDCKDACAAKLIRFFPDQACCNKRGRDLFQCAADQGLQKEVIETCVNEEEPNVCEEVVLGNSNLREIAKIPICQLPIVLYNGKTDRCSKFKNAAEFIQILCGIFKRGNMTNLKPCISHS